MKWFHAAVVVALALGLYLGIDGFLTPWLGNAYAVEPGHTLMLRAARTASVALPALFLFAAFGLARTGEAGRVVAVASTLFLLGLIAWVTRQEYARVAALAPAGADPRQLLRRVDIPLFCATMFALFVALIAPPVSLVRPKRTVRGYNKPVRSKSAAYGDAEWATLEAAGRTFPQDGALILGELYRPDMDPKSTSRMFLPSDPKTWGSGGTKPLMGFDCDFGSTHGLVFSGSGGFKTTGTVIPMLLSWPGNAVVLDPSTELFPMLQDYRAHIRSKGYRRPIHCITPKNLVSGFNVLDWIGSGENSAEKDIAAVIGWIATGPVKRDDPKDFFRNSALQLLRGVLAHICLHPAFAVRPRTLRTLREMISEPENTFRDRLVDLLDTEEDGSFAKLALGPFKSMADQTFSGVYATAADLTNWLAFKEYAAIVSDGNFTSADLVEGDVDVFVSLDLQTLSDYPGVARCIIGALLNALYHADGRIKDRVAFILDEAARIGNMSLIPVARDAGRKYGITLVMIYQSLGQLREQWGGKDAVSDWFESTSWQSFSAITDVDTAKWLSERCGSYTQEIVSYSQQISGGGKGRGASLSASTSLQKRSLILPDEIINTMRRDEQLLFVGGLEPIRCGRPIFYRRADMRDRVGSNRFQTRDGTETEKTQETQAGENADTGAQPPLMAAE